MGGTGGDEVTSKGSVAVCCAGMARAKLRLDVGSWIQVQSTVKCFWDPVGVSDVVWFS